MIVAAARLCPIGRLLERGDITDLYDEFCFAHQVDRVGDVPVLLDHDPARQVGDVARICRRDGWWWAELHIDGREGIDMLTERPHHGVSIGAEVIHEQPAGLLEGARWIRLAKLQEISLTAAPAYPGARVDVTVPIRRTPRPGRPTVVPSGQAPQKALIRNCGQILRVQ